MKNGISTAEMPREEWLKLRKRGIGGSEVGAICGLNPYMSAMSVYRNKVSEEVEDQDNESMRQGRDLEAYVAQRFTEATGLRVRRSNQMYFHEEYPFMLADVDRLVIGEDAGLECKTASAYNADKWKDGGIPVHYALQCYHYMAVTGRKNWYLAVVILGQEFQWRKLSWDDGIIENLILIEEAFWKNHVIPRKIPVPDGSKSCDEVLDQYFHSARKGAAMALSGFDQKIERRMELSDRIKSLEREQKRIDQEIKMAMGEHELAYSDHYQVSWVNVSSSRLDAGRMKAENPDVYRAFLKTADSRKFTVKEREKPAAEASGETVA